MQDSKMAWNSKMYSKMESPVLQVFILLAITFTVKSQTLMLEGPLEANLGEPLRIVCVVDVSLASNIAILEDTTPITDTLTGVFLNGTVRAFTIPTTERSDNGRMLACQLGDEVTPLQIVLIIYLDSIELMPVFNNSLLTLTEGSQADVIQYTIMANPQVDITLTRTDGMPASTRFQVSQTRLSVTGVSRADAGSYNLTFMHRATSNITFYEFTLEVEYGPDVNTTVVGLSTNCVPHPDDSEDFFCTTTLGVNLTITCAVIANPAATLRVTAEQNSNVMVENDESSLARITVDSLRMENLGVYQCIANNTVMEQAINIELSLFAPTTLSTDADTTTTTSAVAGTLPSLIIVLTTLFFLILL